MLWEQMGVPREDLGPRVWVGGREGIPERTCQLRSDRQSGECSPTPKEAPELSLLGERKRVQSPCVEAAWGLEDHLPYPNRA